jgi:predicted N-formylglutamate amidohydrolase
MEPTNNDVFEIVGDASDAGPFVFICEHAGRLVPEWEVESADRILLEDHWGWDIGAADLTRDLISRTHSCGVLTRFSRLVCDPNRDPEEESFVVKEIDGHRLSFNQQVDAAERARRRSVYFDPYHEAIDATLHIRRAQDEAFLLCSVHSFTPVYCGKPRSLEVGVLFDSHDDYARDLAAAIAQQGFDTALNEPYSGKEGLIYAARRHGRNFDRPYVELEIRQDLLQTPEKASTVGKRIAAALVDCGLK